MIAAPSMAGTAAAQGLQLESAWLSSAGDQFVEKWKAFEAQRPAESPLQDPEWLRGYFTDELDKIKSYLIYDRSGAVCGSASFIEKDWPLKLHLGEVPVAELPLRRLRFLGGSVPLPEEETYYDALFQDLLTAPGYDAIHFAQVPVNTFLWKYLTTSPLLGKALYRHRPADPSPHPLLRFGSSFEEYMKKKFSKTHRHTLKRKVTRFQEETAGQLKLVRFTRPEEVSPFLESALEVSRKTYQWNLHQRGLSAVERFERRYRFAADHGWFRSYLLFVGDVPCAFLGGYQWKGRYYTDEIGFDPIFAKHSPGTVLQLMTIQDMFSYDKPELIDFGSYDRYKEELANELYTNCDIILLRRRLSCLFIKCADSCCRMATKAAAGLLDKVQLKRALKKKVRLLSVSGSREDGTHK